MVWWSVCLCNKGCGGGHRRLYHRYRGDSPSEYARILSVSAITTRLLGIESEVNVPISVAGVIILPGDLILGDENGVMVVPRDQINELQRVAAEKEARDPATRARLYQGEALKDLSGAARFAHSIDHPYGKA